MYPTISTSVGDTISTSVGNIISTSVYNLLGFYNSPGSKGYAVQVSEGVDWDLRAFNKVITVRESMLPAASPADSTFCLEMIGCRLVRLGGFFVNAGLEEISMSHIDFRYK